MTRRRFIDLSHAVVSGEPGYPGLPAPRIEPHRSHAASRPHYGGQAEFEITRIFMVGNSGTYLDSPYHRWSDGADIASLPLESVAGLPGRVIDVRLDARRRAGPIVLPITDGDDPSLAGKAVLLRTGWDRLRGTAAYWRPGPYLSAPLAEELVAAGVALVGVDFANADDTADLGRPAHSILLGAGISIVEHLTGLDALPATGFRFFAVPAPVRGAASMPVRAFVELAAEQPAGS